MADRAVAAVEEEEDTPMGTIHMAAAVTTPVAIPTGMTTYGLDIVVKSNAFRCLAYRDATKPALSFEPRRTHHITRQQHSIFFFSLSQDYHANSIEVLEVEVMDTLEVAAVVVTAVVAEEASTATQEEVVDMEAVVVEALEVVQAETACQTLELVCKSKAGVS